MRIFVGEVVALFFFLMCESADYHDCAQAEVKRSIKRLFERVGPPFKQKLQNVAEGGLVQEGFSPAGPYYVVYERNISIDSRWSSAFDMDNCDLIFAKWAKEKWTASKHGSGVKSGDRSKWNYSQLQTYLKSEGCSDDEPRMIQEKVGLITRGQKVEEIGQKVESPAYFLVSCDYRAGKVYSKTDLHKFVIIYATSETAPNIEDAKSIYEHATGGKPSDADSPVVYVPEKGVVFHVPDVNAWRSQPKEEENAAYWRSNLLVG